jgi:uncharacterized Zn finger protein
LATQHEYGRQWWSRRWIETLERAGWEDRLERGRGYARAGHVFDLRVERGRLTAGVRGSTPRPYSVEVQVLPLSQAVWRAVGAALARRAGNLAELLAGHMSEAVADAFAAAGARLFPEELQAECSCPDWATPCKHVAAVCYVFAERLDADPLLLFELRGRTRQQVLADLEGAGSGDAGGRAARGREPRPEAARPSDYWHPGALAPGAAGPAVGLPESLPEPPWWRGRTPLRDVLRRVYALASEEGDAGDGGPPDEATAGERA